ncbi:MAG: hypothetical protein M3N45_14330 [Actinomycetota bacterium]|nr:hypothetical protein [Actinomycetota bacterium]
MANALFIGWGPAVHGREQQALQVFHEALAYFGELQQQGQIEAFEPVALEPHGGDLYGFLLLRGDPDSLSRLRVSEEFRRIVQRGNLVVEDFGVVTAFVGDDLNRLFETFQQHASELAG